MLRLEPARRRLEILLLGAHSDDIEIGCGGTVLELLERYPGSVVTWVVLSAGGARTKEARSSSRRFLSAARRSEVLVHGFRTSFFPDEWKGIKECFETLKGRVDPDLVFTHHREDLHQDHRIVSELTWNTFRDHTILEYEIPKYDGGLGMPNVFIPIRRRFVRRKLAALMSVFATQRSKRWFTPDTFAGLMRLRGVECNAPDGHAEAFFGRKLTV